MSLSSASRSSGNAKEHHYAIDAATLLDKCRRSLNKVMLGSSKTTSKGYSESGLDGVLRDADGDDMNVNHNVLDLDRTLLSTEMLLQYHISSLLERELSMTSGATVLPPLPSLSLPTGELDSKTEEGSANDCETRETPSSKTTKDSHRHKNRSTKSSLMRSVSGLKEATKRNHTRRRTSLPNPQENPNRQSSQHHVSHLERHLSHNDVVRYRSPSSTVISTADPVTPSTPSLTVRYDERSSHYRRTTSRSPSTSPSPSPSPSPSTSPQQQQQYVGESSNSTAASNPRTTAVGTSNGNVGEATSAGSESSGGRTVRGNQLSSRTAIDSLLFRLIVMLQLCHVRIQEARSILCPSTSRLRDNSGCVGRGGGGSAGAQQHAETDHQDGNSSAGRTSETVDGTNHRQRQALAQDARNKKRRTLALVGLATSIAASAFFITSHDDSGEKKITTNDSSRPTDTISPKKNECTNAQILTTAKTLSAIGIPIVVRRLWIGFCMNARLINTVMALEDWQQQWMLIQSIGTASRTAEEEVNASDEQCRRLLQLIPLQKPSFKSSICDPQAAFRSRVIRWTMDTLYASVGTALQMTKATTQINNLLLPITTAAAASFYGIVGPSYKSKLCLSGESSSSSRPELIRNAWGMVSTRTVKTLSLQASMIWKGAAIAERITIEGVPCFVLSKDPCPVLAIAIRRHRRQQERDVSQLSTIFESERLDLIKYPAKDVILHLTGGGFFAHTIAGDLPFLIDWSAKTKAIVICPEYALLPVHTFPTAINEVTLVYTSIVSGNSAHTLGFRTDRIIVTGESAGGNLGAALCVKLCMDGLVDVEGLNTKRRFQRTREANELDYSEQGVDSNNDKDEDDLSISPSKRIPSRIHLPDAIMLCCPALNLSLELSPSRVIGTRDPVLPSSLIATISDAYIPSSLGISKINPIASPYYAPDNILRIFPPTLLYASSEDPLLDDSVHFNARLRRLGVDSDLRAAQDMPHAYWGLGGFGLHPEARQVQRECEEWMVRQLCR